MVEQAAPGPGREGVDDVPLADVSPPTEPARQSAWRRRRLVGRAGRPPWWEVPPSGYLEVESRHSPTRPRALRVMAKAAVKAGLWWNPGRPLPVQSFVAAQERARLVFHARRELPRVSAVASQVMLVDSRLAEAEKLLERTANQRSSAAGVVRRRVTGGSAVAGQAVRNAAGQPQAPITGPLLGQPFWRQALGPWSEVAVLTVVAGGQGVLASVVGRELGLGAIKLGMLSLVAAVGTVAAARLAARGIDRLAGRPDGSQHPDRRRWLDVTVAGGALACGMTLAVVMGRLTAGAAPAALGLALLGLATAVCYAIVADRPGTDADRWRAMVARLRQLQEDRRGRRRLRAALTREAAAQATVRQLREELAVLVPQLFAAEQAALLFWRYQVAIGDAAQHAFEQHLAAFTTRRSRGMCRPIRDWWCGANPAVSDVAGTGLPSIGTAQPDWADQVARVTMPAKRVLVRRGLLDITHGLRLPPLPGAPPAQRNGRPTGRDPDPATGDGARPPVELDLADMDQPDEA